MPDHLFALICFLALTDHHGTGWTQCHPNYLKEKMEILKHDASVYSFLDRRNQLRILEYLKQWKLPLPEWVQEYEKQL